MFFITTKFHGILLSGFRGVALRKKTGLTDWQTGQKHYTPPQLVAWGIIRQNTYRGIRKVIYSIDKWQSNDSIDNGISQLDIGTVNKKEVQVWLAMTKMNSIMQSKMTKIH